MLKPRSNVCFSLRIDLQLTYNSAKRNREESIMVKVMIIIMIIIIIIIIIMLCLQCIQIIVSDFKRNISKL